VLSANIDAHGQHNSAA